jgi:hypothetical protein
VKDKDAVVCRGLEKTVLHSQSFMACAFHQILFRRLNQEKYRLVEHTARMRDRRGTYRVVVRRPEGKKPLGRPRR